MSNKTEGIAQQHDHRLCIDRAIATAVRLCAERGARLTEIRRQVLTLVWQSHTPVSAYDLLDQLKRKRANAAPPTVYRALDFLMAHGLIHRIESINAFAGCASPDNPHDGQFFLCNRCQEYIELNDLSLTRAIDRTAKSIGFTAERETLEVSGLCRKCAP